MSRAAAAAERVAVLLVGLVLLIVGAAAVAWQRDWIPDAVDRVDVSGALDLADEAWWPWAVGVLGVLLVAVALTWLGAHARRRGISHLRLPGSGRDGKLTVDSKALLSAAAVPLDETPGLTSRDGKILRDQREQVIELRAALDPGADLDEAADAAERAAGVLGSYLGPETETKCRVVLVPSRRWAKRTRVR